MAVKRKKKELFGRLNSKDIIEQYVVPYGANDLGRYKHIDELLLKDGKTIKATLGPIDMSIIPFGLFEPYIVKEYEEGRIDLIAFKLFGYASLYWILCYINNITDPLSIKAGDVLYYTDLSSVKQWANPLS